MLNLPPAVKQDQETLMKPLKRTAVFQWLAAALSLAPLILYAYLGQFSRLLSDDYCAVALGQEQGAWDSMLAWYNTRVGSYSNFLLKGALAPLDTLAPRMMPALIIALWLAGLAWLVFQGLAYWRISPSRRALAVTISAWVISASIYALYSPRSFYWYAASARYTLPLALLAIYMALTLWAAQKRTGTTFILGMIAGGALSFITAGLAEMFAVFQLALLSICLLMSFASLRGSARRMHAAALGVGWLAALIGLGIQLIAPGVALRAADIAQVRGLPYRSLSTLMPETLNSTMDYIESPPVFLGSAMLMSLGLLIMLVQYKPPATSKAAPIKLASPPLWFGLMFQLFWMLLLWGHASDSPQWLGRFSSRYMAAVLLNLVFTLSFSVILWQRKRINAQLRQIEPGSLVAGGAMALLLVLAALSTLTQFSGIYSRASAYLFTSSLVLLGIIIRSSGISTLLARRFGFLAFLSYALAVVCTAAVVFIALFGYGYVPPRAMASSAGLLMLSALIWGAWTGYVLKHNPPSSRWGQIEVKLLKLASLAIVLTIGIGIALGQMALVPDFRLYAQEWDARHQEIIAMRDRGQTAIEVAPLTYDLAEYMQLRLLTLADSAANHSARYYYDVAAIVLRETVKTSESSSIQTQLANPPECPPKRRLRL